MKKDNKHIKSSFDGFLDELGILAECEKVAITKIEQDKSRIGIVERFMSGPSLEGLDIERGKD